MATSLADRYRHVTNLQSGDRVIAWLAEDEPTGRKLVAGPIGASRVAGYESIRGLTHANLAAIVDVVTAPAASAIPEELSVAKPAAIVLAEHVPGQTLHERMKDHELSVREAVMQVTAIAHAVVGMHERRMPHGAISPRSIVVTPSIARGGPVLTQLATPTAGTYSSRERLQRRGASLEDDSWALHATLYSTLTGIAPFAGATREELIKNMLAGEPPPIGQYGIAAPELEEILVRGLVHNPRWRPAVSDLARDLERWLSAQSEDDDGVRTASRPEASKDDVPAPSIPPLAYDDSESLRPPASADSFFPKTPASTAPAEPGPSSESAVEPDDACKRSPSVKAAEPAPSTPPESLAHGTSANGPGEPPVRDDAKGDAASAPEASMHRATEELEPSVERSTPRTAPPGPDDDPLLGMFEQAERGRRRGRVGVVIALLVLVLGAIWIARRVTRAHTGGETSSVARTIP